MTEATLDRPRILAVVGKFVGSAVAQHVRNGSGKGNLAVIPGRRRRARHRCDSARIINRTSFATRAGRIDIGRQVSAFTPQTFLAVFKQGREQILDDPPRDPVLISMVTAMPGERFTKRSSACTDDQTTARTTATFKPACHGRVSGR